MEQSKVKTPRGDEIKSFVIVGPESTGKTTLAKTLAQEYNTFWVPEYARKYLSELDRPYGENDLNAIAKGQLDLEDKFLNRGEHILFFDTNLLVIKVWSIVKFGRCSPFVLQQLEKRKYTHYLLTFPDLSWEYDVQREDPDRLEYLFDIYKAELENYKVSYGIIKGRGEKRFHAADSIVRSLI